MKKNVPSWEVYKSTQFVGLVKAVSHAKAYAIAQSRYGISDVELATERKAYNCDRLSANGRQQAKQLRRYPTPGFDARREALIAEVLGR